MRFIGDAYRSLCIQLGYLQSTAPEDEPGDGQEEEALNTERLLRTKNDVRKKAMEEQGAEAQRIKELADLNRVLVQALANLREQVKRLNKTIGNAQGTGQHMVEKWKTLTKEVKNNLETADLSISKTLRAKQAQAKALLEAQQALLGLDDTRLGEERKHTVELEKYSAKLERLQREHAEAIDRDIGTNAKRIEQ